MKEIKVSPEFKAQTTKAIFSIILFVLTYILMLLLAAGLTVLCIYGGLMIIAIKPMLITLAFGIGLSSLGVLVLYFLLKFIFKSHKIDRSHLREIRKEDEPKLFNIIDDIVKEVGTKFPKKVYLSSDVNASVFYDSTFWSMFFPIKKNLQIGLGLVNTVTQSELKAILSHEFGHFSQRTMKVGSYVYNVNQVIFNLLFDNESYDNLLRRWANTSNYVTIFVFGAAKIVEGIKWVLKQVFTVLNKNYMALSREMEFHADEIAAHVTGYPPLIDSLLRLSYADNSFNTSLSFYNNKISENIKADNIYRDHLYVLNFLAKNNKITISNNLPQISKNDINRFNKSKLIIKNQWASHPSIEDRIEMLKRTGLSSSNQNNESANLLFTNIENIQKEITEKIFEYVNYSGECSVLSFEEFQSEFEEDFFKEAFPKKYNGYYDNMNPVYFDIKSIDYSRSISKEEDLFSNSKIELIYTAISLQNDIESIKQIASKEFDIKTFDYDGIKYSKNDCDNLISQLEKEFGLINENIKLNDIEIFKYFFTLENKLNLQPTLELLYSQFFSIANKFDERYQIYVSLSNELQFINVQTPIDEIKANFNRLKPLEERLKKEIEFIIEDQEFRSELTDDIIESFNEYKAKKLYYFGVERYIDENLDVLFKALNHYGTLLSDGYIKRKRKLLNYQLELLDISENKVG